MEGSVKRLQLLTNFWKIAFLEEGPRRVKVRIAAYERGLRNDSKIRGKNGEWNRRAPLTRLDANLKHHT
jgi:hypothetical protein